MRKSFLIVLSCVLVVGYFYRFAGRNSSLREQHRPALKGILPGMRAPAAMGKKQNEGADRAESFDVSLAKLQKESARPWSAVRRETGLLLSDGALELPGDTIEQRAHAFLQKYSQSLLGISPASLLEGGRDNDMIRFQETENGVPVWNSKIALFFNEHGELVHLIANVHGGSSSRSVMDISQARALAKMSLEKYVANSGGNISDYRANSLAAQNFLYDESGERRQMFRFVVPLLRPLGGEYEILVDASLGQIFSARNIARQ